jgi:hypothetical protein
MLMCNRSAAFEVANNSGSSWLPEEWTQWMQPAFAGREAISATRFGAPPSRAAAK